MMIVNPPPHQIRDKVDRLRVLVYILLGLQSAELLLGVAFLTRHWGR